MHFYAINGGDSAINWRLFGPLPLLHVCTAQSFLLHSRPRSREERCEFWAWRLLCSPRPSPTTATVLSTRQKPCPSPRPRCRSCWSARAVRTFCVNSLQVRCQCGGLFSSHWLVPVWQSSVRNVKCGPHLLKCPLVITNLSSLDVYFIPSFSFVELHSCRF